MTNDLHQQEQVNAYFQAQSLYWKDVYTRRSIFAEILRDRQAAVLDLIDRLALAPGSRVLEVGCGAGFLSMTLARRGFRVHAIDSVEAMVEQAREQTRESGMTERLSLDVGDVSALAFDDESFDLVLAVAVIPWLAQPLLALEEMARVTKPGGHVVLLTANRMALPNLLDPQMNPALAPLRRRVKHALERVGLCRWSSNQLPHMTYHDCRFIDDALASAGLVKIRGMTLGFEFSLFCHRIIPEPLGIALHQRLQRLANRNFPAVRSLGMNYIVLARKYEASTSNYKLVVRPRRRNVQR